MKPEEGETWVHCKGDEYIIVCIGEHTETKEELVAYESKRTGKVWIRPLSMFLSNHDSGVPRFTRKLD